jgi:PAS domain S-box-containing protein
VKRRSSSEEALALLRQRITELEGFLVQHEQSAAAEQQAAEQYTTMLATTSDGFWRVGRNGKLQDVNEAYCRMSGYSREELLQMSIPHLEAVESADSTARHIRKLIENGSDRFETKHQSKSGRIIDVEVSATYLPSSQELIVFVRSISDQKLAEGALRRGEARYRSLFENMLDGFAYCQMLFVDERPQDFVYLEVNSAFERLTGLEDVVGRRVSEVIPGIRETHPELLETYGRVALTGERERFELYLKPLGVWLLISAYSGERESDCPSWR